MDVGESRIDPERADAGLIGRCLEGDDDAWERLVQQPEGSIGPTRGRCLEQLRLALQAIEGAA